MRKILAMFAILFFMVMFPLAGTTDQFQGGLRFTSFKVISLSMGGINFDAPANEEIYFEYKPLDWLGIEISGQIGNSALIHVGTAAESVFPSLTLMVHPLKLEWIDIYAGIGGQYASESGYYEISSSYSDSNGNQINQVTRNNLTGGGLSMIFQAGANVPASFILGGLSFGVDVKYTPSASSTVDLSNGFVSFNNSPWTQYQYANTNFVITKLLQISIGVSYSF